MKLPLSVCVITRNEERRLRECLESVRDHVDEIVVLDSLSEDRTREIARTFTDRVFEQAFLDFSSQKNRCTQLASHDWVLVLDADERMPAEAWPHVARALARARRDGISAFALPRATRFIDGKYHHWIAYWPNFQWRLYDRRRCRYVGRVHEMLAIGGRRGCVGTEFLHVPDRPLGEFLPKAELYQRLKHLERDEPSVPRVSPWRRMRSKVLDLGFYARALLIDMGWLEEGPTYWFFALGWLSLFAWPPLRPLFSKVGLWRRCYPGIRPYLDAHAGLAVPLRAGNAPDTLSA